MASPLDRYTTTFLLVAYGFNDYCSKSNQKSETHVPSRPNSRNDSVDLVTGDSLLENCIQDHVSSLPSKSGLVLMIFSRKTFKLCPLLLYVFFLLKTWLGVVVAEPFKTAISNASFSNKHDFGILEPSYGAGLIDSVDVNVGVFILDSRLHLVGIGSHMLVSARDHGLTCASGLVALAPKHKGVVSDSHLILQRNDGVLYSAQILNSQDLDSSIKMVDSHASLVAPETSKSTIMGNYVCVKMSSSEEFREGNTFSRESNSSISSINLEDYLEPEPEIEITGARQSSPRIGDLPQDQWPRHIRDAPAFSSGYQYIEGNWLCTNVRTSCTSNKLRKIASSYNIAIPLRLPMEFNRPHTPSHGLASFSEVVLKCGMHLPLYPYIKSIVDYYGVVPFQLTPNTYRYMIIGIDPDSLGISSQEYKINDLLVEEFNWKVLGTTNNLVACGLIPKGAAFPDPPVISSRPSSSKKKPRKRTDLGALSSRIRKRKAPATPARSEPSSPETVSPPAPQPAPQEEEMVIGSSLRAPPSTLGSMVKTKTPESTLPSKGKEKVDCSRKRKVAFEDVPTSSPPPQPSQLASTPEPPTEAATSSEPNLADKGDELFALLNQLPKKACMSTAFIDRFTSEKGWERIKRRSAKVAFGSAMRMLANVSFSIFSS
ncbi:hypothetical protein PanWU01x14_217620 [Parasponia andersonii]|uniref:Uncharacterized protein n=1 Tax=Parasponia andersonii TaxID=3476 RepID=A0A2P5BR64_PARAD|nr:hypothetical protein PanWU01x14_217620 [Parasponia andersonii]